jgi:hypothetical protein
MTSPRTIDPGDSFDDVEEELRHTYLSCMASPLTQALAAPFAALRTELLAVRGAFIDAEEAVEIEQLRCRFIDDALNLLLDESKVAVNAQVKGDYDDPFYDKVWNGYSPSALRKFVLADQLAVMRLWPALFGSVAGQVFADLATQITKVVGQADVTLDALTLAEGKLDGFNLGPRAAFIDKVNAARNLAYGKLRDIALTQAGMPSGFAERFFLHDAGARARSIADIEKDIARAEARLKKLQGELALANKKKEDAAKAKQTEKAAAIKKAEDKVAAAAKELSELKAQLGASDA